MLSRRITSTVIERCRDLLASATFADALFAKPEVPLELRDELEQLHKKMTSMLRHAEKLEGAQEKALVLEQEELKEILGRIEVFTFPKKSFTDHDPKEFPNESWLPESLRQTTREQPRVLKVDRHATPKTRVRTTTISAPYRMSIEREVRPGSAMRAIPGIANPAAVRVAERLLREGHPFDRVAQKIGVSTAAVRELAQRIEAEFHDKVRRSSKVRSKRIAKQPELRKPQAANESRAEAVKAIATQGKECYEAEDMPQAVVEQLEGALQQQARTLEAVASITLGRSEGEERKAEDSQPLAGEASVSPFVRQQVLL